MIVDTSIWVDHAKRSHLALVAAMSRGIAHVHDMVMGELTLGGMLRNRATRKLLSELPRAAHASHDEVLALVDAFGLAGAGIGWIDAHLLASARIGGTGILTSDLALSRAAARVGVSTRLS